MHLSFRSFNLTSVIANNKENITKHAQHNNKHDQNAFKLQNFKHHSKQHRQ